MLVLGQAIVLLPSAKVTAATPPSLLLISEVETTGVAGGNDVPAEEFVKLTNLSPDTLEVNGWKLNYINGSGTVTLLANLTGFIQPHGSVLIAHDSYPLLSGVVADKYFSSGNTSVLGKTVGQVQLVDSLGQTADQVGWGTATVSAPWPKLVQIPAGFSVKRIIPGHILFGTGLDYTWGTATQPLVPVGGAFLIDVCPNLSGAQSTLPVGSEFDDNGHCEPDACLNIGGLQISVLDGYDSDDGGNCFIHDECDNITGIQTEIPEYRIRDGVNSCSWNIPGIVLTEILPNSIGSDTGNEFIEVYNPTNQTIDLSLFSVKTGISSDKTYAFPIGSTIGPGEYRSFSDSVMKFTLVNTSSRVVLTAVDSETKGDTNTYDSPGDGESWALIEGVWEYTNRPTPGAPNLASLIEEHAEDLTDTGLAPCPAGKYRHPLTNRCRNIDSDASVLASCEADQYRNPETGRCKKISVTSLAACKDDQYRSEETNRCRNVLGASTSKPCKDNQYRSEETNRCRNIAASNVPDAAFAVQPVKDTGMAFVGWWALGGIGLLAVGYGAWEWRRELLDTFAKWTKR
jgi:hypothetical protein